MKRKESGPRRDEAGGWSARGGSAWGGSAWGGWAWGWKELRELFVENLGWKLLTGLLAVLVWGWIQGERVVPASAWVSVDYELPEGLVLTQTPTQRIRVTVSGTQNLTRDLRSGELTLSVDLSELGPGVQTVDFVDTHILGLPETLEVVALKPNSLQVELEPEAQRPVRLEATVVGQAADGYRLANVTLTPAVVQVSGPASVVEKLDRVVTSAIVLDGLKADTEREIGIDLASPLRILGSVPVVATLRIEAVNSTRTFTAVPVVCRDPSWRPLQETVSVVLEGPVQELQALEVDALTVMVVLPSDPGVGPLSIGMADPQGARLEVIFPGGNSLEVAALEPPRIDVETGSE